MKVDLEKKFDKNGLIPLKPQFNVLLSGKKPSKLALGKISYVIFCKLAKIMKQVDNVRQGVSLFD